jgi:hypothetical protein
MNPNATTKITKTTKKINSDPFVNFVAFVVAFLLRHA